MNPIYGLSETPKVGLEEAIQGTGLLGLEGCIMLALMFADSNPDSVLDREEVASLNMYTMQSPFYPALNKALGTKDRSKIVPFFKYLRLALGAMYKCPLVKATFSRGIKNPNLANYYEGRPNFVWWSFTSSTNNIAVTKQFLGAGPRMLFIIDGAGVDISKYSSFPEAEVLVLPGTLLQVQGVLAEAGGLTITHLRQLPSPPLLDFVHPGLVSALGVNQAVVASSSVGAAEALTKQVSESMSVFRIEEESDDTECTVSDIQMQLQGMGFSDEQIEEGCKHGDKAEEVVEWITAHEEMEKARKDYAEGDRWFYGYGQGVDWTNAARCYRRAAEARYAPAAYALGRCYCNGLGVGKDEDEGSKWCGKAVNEMGLKELAEQGDAAAQYRFGIAYEKGMGVAKDEAEAVRWWRKAAEQGHAEAQGSLGYAYMNGEGVAKDEAEAVRWRRKAAEQGHAGAQYSLGFAYEKGVGVAKDEAEAARWWRKAAEQGNAFAQHSLGIAYKKGEGVAEDEAEAVRWWRKAAEQGNAGAQYSLGIAYENGWGVAEDEAEAVRWLKKAAEQGHEGAQELLDSMG
jgi:TPR repeat protein